MTDQNPVDADHAKWLLEMQREDAHRAHDEAKNFYQQVNEYTIKAGENALRAFLLINGGAAVSVLAFIGGLGTGRSSLTFHNSRRSLTV